MLTGIDHIVIAVPDLASAQKSYETLGFTVVPGGRHPVGTHNALIGFADGSYIELIAFYEKNTAHKWWEPLQRGGGLVDFCMQTNDLAGDTAAFRRAGVTIDDPSPLSRLRPDGYQLKWVLSIPRGDHKGVAPFLIQDETPREERVPRQTRHANGVSGIGTVVVAVDETARVRGWYEDTLGRPGQPIVRSDVGGRGVRFTVGPHTLEFLAPQETTSPLRTWLAARGASPYEATLRTVAGHRDALDPARTLGARLTLVMEDAQP
jgi:catechol 2,3-dioxygenase-like lactoylglutathione lyase family enzyme